MTDEVALDMAFAALADPTRRGILAQLALGDATVNDLAKPYEMTLSAVSKHLKVLETAGLVSKGRRAQWRHCHLEAQPLANALSWLEQYRRFWDRSLDSLDDHLKARAVPTAVSHTIAPEVTTRKQKRRTKDRT